MDRDEMAKELLLQEETGGENAYAALFKEAEGIPVGSDGLIVLPYFQGEGCLFRIRRRKVCYLD